MRTHRGFVLILLKIRLQPNFLDGSVGGSPSEASKRIFKIQLDLSVGTFGCRNSFHVQTPGQEEVCSVDGRSLQLVT